ncbi:MAG: hypothetical protein HQ522_03045 [Bacteroidetes bacterium]|nr:hypothetical protein [Bacteroidota bacterium]
MTLNNKKQATKYKRIFFIVSIFIALSALALFLLDFTFYALACVGLFSLWFLYFHVADYQFIQFSSENEKVILRYYKAVRFGQGEYSSIEFPQHMLRKVYFENSIFGKMSDITVIVKTKRGIAEYPSVSLSAVSIEDRIRMQDALHKILDN